MQDNKGKILKAFRAAFPRTIPVLTGYAFLGLTYGIYLNSVGLPLWLPVIMTLCIFSGSAEILAVGFLAASFDPVNALVIALMTGARYLFYGISMLDKYKGYGWKKFFYIYGSVDETFSINFQTVIPDGVDKGWFYLFVTWLDHLYWIAGSLFGAFFGSVIKFNTTGLDFVVTAMFIVIFLNQWLTEKKHYSELIGIGSAVFCLVIFKAQNFIIPTMVFILALLAGFKKPLENMVIENDLYKLERSKEAVK